MICNVNIRGLWAAWLLLVLLMAAIYLGAWNFVFQLVITPNLAQAVSGLRGETFPLAQPTSHPTSSVLLPQASFDLDQPQTSLRARGMWMVGAAGDYVLRIQCDDNGRLALDH